MVKYTGMLISEIPLIPIEVTPDVAVKLRFLFEEGIFDMRGGSATLNFAPNGELKSIKKELFAYSRGVDKQLA